MQDLIYFPNFEPQNNRWLKFALLYIDEFRPIIPYSRKDDISDTYKRIQEETDLVNSYSPNYSEGKIASDKTINEIEELFINIKDKNYLFDYQNIHDNIKNKREYLIYQEKFSSEFERYCIERNLATQSSNGLYLSEELGYIYMTNLANEIAYIENSSIITDKIKFTNYSNSKRIQNQKTQRKMKLAESVIDLKLPVNIDDISFNDLIKFRNKKKNRKLLKSFHKELNKINESDINNITTYGFLQDYNEIYSELIAKISVFGVSGASIAFTMYSLLENNDMSTFDYAKELTSTLGGISGIGYGIYDVMKETREKRQVLKYFANLSKL